MSKGFKIVMIRARERGWWLRIRVKGSKGETLDVIWVGEGVGCRDEGE